MGLEKCQGSGERAQEEGEIPAGGVKKQKYVTRRAAAEA